LGTLGYDWGIWQAYIVVLGAAGLDFLIGDPWTWPHPVQAMGWVITRYTQFVFKSGRSPIQERLMGIVLTLILVWGSGAIAWSLLTLAEVGSSILRGGIEIVMLASCFAGRSLRRAAEDVLTPLNQGDVTEARARLSRYVGRDTQHLDEPEILRAVLETVSENSVDGVMAPLFYALLGLSLPMIGPVPLAIAYKAASTLDSMVGYRTKPYTHLGWCSAKTDDLLTWLPCRLTVFTLGLLSGRPKQVWHLCARDAPQDPSPKSGWSECAYAATLGVQLGGENHYRGVMRQKPFVGDNLYPITPDIIRQGLQLTRHGFMLWVVLTLSVLAAIHYG